MKKRRLASLYGSGSTLRFYEVICCI